MPSDDPLLRSQGPDLIDGRGRVVRLKGVGLGGWLNMENFITGYAGNESMMRAEVAKVLGPDRARMFFDRLLTSFFGDADAAFLADAGVNSIRLPVNYRHLEDDAAPFTIIEEGFAQLDRVVEVCARHGIYSIIDLHALPGYQNHHWHSDNPTHEPTFWMHPHFQDRAVHLWEAIASRYRDNPWVAGYNPVNEPADETRAVIGPFYRRLVDAIRAVDPRHLLFLDANTYSTEPEIFEQQWGPHGVDGAVYTCHDYALAGFGYGGDYPGRTRGTWVDKDTLEQTFLRRSAFSRTTGTPIWVGEFGPVYTGDPDTDAQRRQILEDQLEIYRRHGAGWSVWTYKDIGVQGLLTVRPDTAYRRRFDDFVSRKNRLGADHWGNAGVGVAEVTQPVQDLVAREFPGFDPYPFGAWEWVRTLLLNVMLAGPLARDYATLFGGLDDSELVDLADSFAFDRCDVRQHLLEQIRQG